MMAEYEHGRRGKLLNIVVKEIESSSSGTLEYGQCVNVACEPSAAGHESSTGSSERNGSLSSTYIESSSSQHSGSCKSQIIQELSPGLQQHSVEKSYGTGKDLLSITDNNGKKPEQSASSENSDLSSVSEQQLASQVEAECDDSMNVHQEVQLSRHVQSGLSKSSKSLWHRLQLGWKKPLGVRYINTSHRFYVYLQAVSMGMTVLRDDPRSPGPEEKLTEEHYQTVIQEHLVVDMGGVSNNKFNVIFISYAPAVFATIRRAMSIDDKLFFDALAMEAATYLEFISNSKSGQDFFFTQDMRFLIKTNQERDIKFFLSILGRYLEHFLSFPHSILVKYIGCYSVKVSRKKKPEPAGSNSITVLKDQNFFLEKICLEFCFHDDNSDAIDGDWFVQQLAADSSFLSQMNVLDYSLLIGRHKLHLTDKKQTISQLLSRIHRSKDETDHGACGRILSRKNVRSSIVGQRRHHSQASLCCLSSEAQQGTDRLQLHRSLMQLATVGLSFPHSLAEEVFGSARCRLLQNCQNPLHIVDGPQYRYYVGIIDFLKQWDMKQRLARLWKSVRFCCAEHSTVAPERYARRFCRFIGDRVTR